MMRFFLHRSMRVYVPTPPPFLERGIAELVFRRAAYVPLSRIKPSRSSVLCREYSYSAVVDVLTALIVVTVAGSMFSSGFFGGVIVSTSESC